MTTRLDPPPANFDDNPAWTDATFDSAKPFSEGFPELMNKGGRPKSDNRKVHVNFRLAADLVDSIKATGRGYNARVEKVLRDALTSGQL